jgi:Bacterial RNA polymerase, alpha chain C terminal domain
MTATTEVAVETQRRWTIVEDTVLKEGYESYVPIVKIAEKIDRTVRAVRKRVSDLRLRRSYRVSVALRQAPEHLRTLLGTMSEEQWLAGCTAWHEAAAQERKERKERGQARRQVELAAIAAEIDSQSLSRSEKIVAKRAAGMTLKEVGRQHGISDTRVQQIEAMQSRRATQQAQEAAIEATIAAEPPALLHHHIDSLGLSTRARNGLVNMGVVCVADLVEQTEVELLRGQNLGHKSLKDIKDALARLGLCLTASPPTRRADRQQLASLITAWDRSSQGVREAFLERVGLRPFWSDMDN